MLENNHSPRSVQTFVDDLPLKAGLSVIEAPTGSGKTEAALAYAWRLIEAGFAESIIFALPTQASANAMLERIERFARKLFSDNPNVVLAHGSSRFNEEFTKLKHAALKDLKDEDGWTQCSEWLAESRKRVFLGQIGVCTVDQVLISVLPVRHWFVRSFGIGRSILIIDEVHAYDAYMYGLLEEVLRDQKSAGGSAILLSATLPEFQRTQLSYAWDSALDEIQVSDSYPLLTWCGNSEIILFKPADSERPDAVTVSLESIKTDDMLPDDSLIHRIIEAAERGAQVAVICNLVDAAQKLAQILNEKSSVPVDLFHARFCYKHRQEKELDAIGNFGPKGTREKGRILVATQVVEQSLDLDFDWIITQLCPVDLLFQRMGRLHRHKRTDRPAGFEKPLCTVLQPAGSDYGYHGLIYANTRLLWRTSLMLQNAPSEEVVFPAAYREWIEIVYQEDPWQDEPSKITKEYEKFKNEIEFVKKCKARYLLDTKANPFNDTDERVTALTRDGEMKKTLVPFCIVPEGKQLMDGTLLNSLDKNQKLEALALNSIGVPDSWKKYFNETDKDGRYWLEMEKKGDTLTAVSNGITFRYHNDWGLERII